MSDPRSVEASKHGFRVESMCIQAKQYYYDTNERVGVDLGTGEKVQFMQTIKRQKKRKKREKTRKGKRKNSEP